MIEKTHLEWTGRPWELQHAIDFWSRGYWGFDFAAYWLGVSEDQFSTFIRQDRERNHE